MRTMTILLVVGVLLVAVVFSGVVFPSRPAVHAGLDSTRLRSMIEALYWRGYDGGMLFLEVRDADAFIQIRKQIREVGDVVLRSDFPQADWSSEFYPKIKAYLDSAGIQYDDTIGPTDLAVQGAVPTRTLVVFLGSDLQVAQRYVEFVTREVFGIDPATQLVATLENVAARDIKIGFD